MDLKEAYQFLDLPEDCTMEDLEARYIKLTERKLFPEELSKIHEAYNVIRNDLEPKTPKPKRTFKQKVSDFFYVYRAHVRIGILVLIFAIAFTYSYNEEKKVREAEAELPTPAVEVMFFGEYWDGTDLERTEERVYEIFPDWERVKFQIVYAPDEENAQLSLGDPQRSAVLLAAERPDIYILDQNHYERFIINGPFVPLDEYEDEIPDQSQWLRAQKEDDEEEHIYGIDLTDNEIFAGTEVEEEPKYAVIRTDSENIENAIQFLIGISK